jgi:phosphatidate cytidylyltransferase
MHFTLKDTEINWIIVTAIISVMNQPGDLIESMMKRSVQVKDSGSILPGHGGMLDRCDSLFILFPLIYFYFSLR